MAFASKEDEVNPSYPILAWDGKAHPPCRCYSEEGKVKLFVYDVSNIVKVIKQEIPQFDQVQDVKYMLNANTLL
jgi:hypothetical protein